MKTEKGRNMSYSTKTRRIASNENSLGIACYLLSLCKPKMLYLISSSTFSKWKKFQIYRR